VIKLARPEDIGALVRDRRRALGMSQAELGARIGARQAWVSELERGKATLQLGKVLKALRTLEVTLGADHAGLTAALAEPPRAAPSSRRRRPAISVKDIVDG
jgi:transcriptional regulator with XRE-family HTH domain